MPNDQSTRWTVTVSKDTDLALRTHLGSRGMRKGDISKFIEDAVRWRMFESSRRQVHDAFADLSADDVESLVDEAVTATREASRTTPPAGT